MKLSAHFTLSEATKSQTAERLGIDNTPSPAVIERMKATCEAILEPVCEHFKRQVVINSFYRCPEVNSAIGSAPYSQHVTGEAVDFEIPGVSNDDLAAWVRDNLTYDQLIREFSKPGVPDSGWVHASFKASGCRAECLTINSQGTFAGLLT